jgi:hypothetical protein
MLVLVAATLGSGAANAADPDHGRTLVRQQISKGQPARRRRSPPSPGGQISMPRG